MKQKVKRLKQRKEPHKTRPFYLHNEDHPKQEPVPQHSIWIATILAVIAVIALAWFLSSCAVAEGFKESNEASGLGGRKANKEEIRAHNERASVKEHIVTSADGP